MAVTCGASSSVTRSPDGFVIEDEAYSLNTSRARTCPSSPSERDASSPAARISGCLSQDGNASDPMAKDTDHLPAGRPGPSQLFRDVGADVKASAAVVTEPAEQPGFALYPATATLRPPPGSSGPHIVGRSAWRASAPALRLRSELPGSARALLRRLAKEAGLPDDAANKLHPHVLRASWRDGRRGGRRAPARDPAAARPRRPAYHGQSVTRRGWTPAPST